MPTYRVSHKVRTVAHLSESVQLSGFSLERLVPGNSTVEAWVATEEADAADVATAVNSSRQRLLPVIDALATVLQCSFSLIGTSFLAYRLVDNPDNIILFRHVRSRKTTGMPLWTPEQIADVERLLKGKDAAALRYFREAMNAGTSSACLAMLVIVSEALAGQSIVIRSCSNCGHQYQRGGTNEDVLLDVLGEEAYRHLYEKKHGSIRHRLLHGNAINEDKAAILCASMYEKILSYLRRTIGLQAVKRIDEAPRKFETFEWAGAFLKLRAVGIPTLHELEQNWQKTGEWINDPTGY